MQGQYRCTVKDWAPVYYDELNILVEKFNPIQRTRSYRSYVNGICSLRDEVAYYIQQHHLEELCDAYDSGQ